MVNYESSLFLQITNCEQQVKALLDTGMSFSLF